MPGSRFCSLSLYTCLVIVLVIPSSASADRIDWRSSWCPLADIQCLLYNYDCGGYTDVAVKGNLAYAIGDNHGLQVVDITNRHGPDNRGSVGIWDAYRLALWDHYAYVTTRTSSGVVTVVELNDHDAPLVLETIALDGQVHDIIAAGGYLYLTFADGRLCVYSIDDPESPQLIQTLNNPLGAIKEMALDDGRLCAAGPEGLVVYDVEYPASPFLLGSLPLTGSIHALAANGNRALVGYAMLTRIIDVTTPGAMVEMVPISQSSVGLHLTDGQAWLGISGCWSDPGMRIYDITDDQARPLLYELGSAMRGYPKSMVETQGVVVAGEHMCWCAGEWPSLYIFRTGTLPPPNRLSQLTTASPVSLLAVDDVLYVGTTTVLQIWDVSEPAEPLQLDEIDSGRVSYVLSADGPRILALEYPPGSSYRFLRLYDRTDGWELVPRGALNLGDQAVALTVVGDLVLVATGEDGELLVVDISDSDAPTQLAAHYVGSDVNDVTMSENLAAANIDGQIRFLDVSDPLVPVELGFIPENAPDFRDRLQFLRLDGEVYLLCANNRPNDWYEHRDSTEIWAITDPAQPEQVFRLRHMQDDFCHSLSWRDGVLYIQGSEYLTLYAWSGPEAEQEFLGRVRCGFGGYDGHRALMTLASGTVVSARAHVQVDLWPLQQVLPTGAPEAFPTTLTGSALRVAPNPFNPQTTIEFALDRQQRAEIAVYDLTGRQIAVLVDRTYAAGEHSVVWNGKDAMGRAVPSGTYVVRLSTESTARARKVLLLR